MSTPVQMIRPAVLADAALLADLGVRTFRETFEDQVSPVNLQLFLDSAYGEALQQAELADPTRPGLVLELAGRPVGFAQLRLGRQEPCVTGTRPVELQRIYVLREAQGHRCDFFGAIHAHDKNFFAKPLESGDLLGGIGAGFLGE